MPCALAVCLGTWKMLATPAWRFDRCGCARHGPGARLAGFAGGFATDPPDTLRTMAAALADPDCAVVMPVYQGERGHPVGFAAGCSPSLLALTGEQGAASVVRAQAQQGRVRQVKVDDEGTVTDIDTVQDLERAAQLLAARG